jgi:adenylate cyclase
VLVQILDKALHIMDAERGFLMLTDLGSDALRVHVARDRGGDITGVEREEVSRSLMERVRAERRPLLVMQAQSPEWATDSVVMHSIHSACCTPLMTRDRVDGVLYVDSRRPEKVFGQADLAFFSTFALQAKVAIDASRTYWELVDSLFKASEDFVVVCGIDGHVNQANVAAERLVGAPLAGRPLASLFSDSAAAQALFGGTLEAGVGPAQELDLVRTGRDVPMSLSGFALRDRTGAPIGVCFIGHDLTQIRHLIAQLEVRNRFIRDTFGRYLSDEVVENLLAAPEHLQLGGETRRVTIMMTDLRGFTGLTEHLAAQDVVRMLNNYLSEMVEVIQRHKGTIDEIIGDAILVLFGAPESRADDALRACACAVEMQQAMSRVNAWNRANGLPAIEMGIGLNTGDVIVGNIGSEKRSKYAVVGKHVNLAARIEGNTLGGQILVSERTAVDAGPTLELGDRRVVRAKGIGHPVEIIDLLGVGPPYDVDVPTSASEPPVVPLQAPLAVRVSRVEGKSVSESSEAAIIVGFGGRVAQLEGLVTDDAGDLCITVPSQPGMPEVYAKSLGVSGGRMTVRISVVPTQLEALLAGPGQP